MTDATVISRPNPYVGPRSFKIGETIYGRERESSELLDLLIAERIVLLYSPSGAGKSSILNAAIFPRMEEQGFTVLPVMRVSMEAPPDADSHAGFNRYIHSLEQSLEESAKEEVQFSHESLLELRFNAYLQKFRERQAQVDPNYDPTKPILLIIDQMEEILTLNPTDRDKKMDFFIQVGEALRDKSIWALFSIREDYVAALDPYLRPIPTRLETRYRLNLLEVEPSLEAIRRPAEQMGVAFNEDAARKLAHDLCMVRMQQADGNTEEVPGLYVQPVQLQVVCRRLWSKLPREDVEISIEDVEAIGDVGSALSDYYSIQVAIAASETGVSERAIREWFDRKLITVNGVRGQVLMAPGSSDGLENKTIWRLEQSYLVRAERRGGAVWFELAHDRLLRPVRENNGHWFNENLSALQRQADVWNSSGRIEGMLMTGKDYYDAREWAEKNTPLLIPVEREFIEASEALQQRLNREHRTNIMIRWLFGISVVIGILAVIAAFLAFKARNEAIARSLAADASNTVVIDPEYAVMLALTSVQSTYMGPLDESIQVLHYTLPQVRLEHVFQGHEDKVYAAVYSPDGATIASASKDGSVRIWKSSGELVNTLVFYQPNEEVSMTNLVFSPDGKMLYVSDENGKVWAIETQGWTVQKNFQAHGEAVWALAISPDGRYLGTGSYDYTAKIWDTASWQLVHTLGSPFCKDKTGKTCNNGHTGGINAVAFNHDGSLLASAGDDMIIRLWDVATGEFAKKIGTSGGHEGSINGLDFNPDGTKIASSSEDRTIKIWDVETRERLVNIKAIDGSAGHVDWVYGVAFTADGASIISSSADRTVRIWDTEYGRLQKTLNGHTGQVYSVAINPQDGNHVVTASDDMTLRTWDISRTGTSEILTMDNKEKIYDAEYSPDGKLIATGGREMAVKLWDASTGEMLKFLNKDGHTLPIESINWHPSGKYIASGGRDGKVIVWDVETGEGKTLFTTEEIDPEKKKIYALSYNPDGSLIAFGGGNGKAYIINATSGELLHVLDTGNPDAGIMTLKFSPSGERLATGYNNDPYQVIVWDWQNEKTLYILDEHTDFVQGVAFNPLDENVLATVSDDSTLLIYNLSTYNSAKYGNISDLSVLSLDTNPIKASGHIGTVYDVKFNSDGTQIVTGGGDGLVKVWDAATGEFLLNLHGNTNRVLAIDINPLNAEHIVSGGEDFTIRTFTLNLDELIAAAESRITHTQAPEKCEEKGIDPEYCAP